ncbi:nucleoside diphosphate kinase [Thecamonas trahens ATCC 50062]|uniref:Nucleoside diphosphate kinase n=1 Tax=Thecamonas trahens ATCC 50062 TaxID=461836 RepID=A0A0L0DJE1_THETB|nr:nucleoside diphosphate kinase [Thecamonas trahens ATCC 50062]KNC52524.1 nucleoside diphosphate kinase [Thecamonas trahens ATCC 50062]|eukprot:XP_013755317.1 nucleoside diphosphate kinase [Thecamonas trahens ATCC 50062]
MADSSAERTYVMIKPDGVARGLIGDVISRFENKGLQLVAMKLVQVTPEHAEKHYEDLKSKPFFAGLVEFITSGPVCAMVWKGPNAVRIGRLLVGATNPAEAAVGTVRGDLAADISRNIVHASDAVESANHEIALWFKDEEITSWDLPAAQWICE